jgi:hypothetical protein
MSRKALPALLLILPLSFAPQWMDLARLVFAEILSAVEGPGPEPNSGPGMDPWGAPEPTIPGSTDTSPGMDPWG